MGNLLAKTAYPGVIFIAIAFHLYLINSQSIIVATYIPVFLGVMAVTLLEIYTPERTDWWPDGSEIGNDAIYMVIIQVLLPRLLGFFFVFSLIGPMQNTGLVLEGYWPHQWPIGLQVVAMILMADFLRYWLHRIAHENAFLWRFHAVHHSVPKLYWLNVGRFHYVDKSLQFLLDVLPFMILGVHESVLALYFVFYSINGFFQHSNVKLSLGIFNYIISTAELHRWHHSRLSKESNTNYGNNIIIWDLLFGTWFLPSNRKVKELGLHNKNYPYSFINQLKTPYIDGINDRNTILLGYGDILRNWLIKIGMLYNQYCLWRPLKNAASDPRAAQLRLLEKILGDFKATRFGEKYIFNKISNYRDYVENIPVQTYEDLRPLIEAQLATGDAELTPSTPLMYALTSGTTGKPKMLPILDSTLKQQRRTQRIFSYLQYCQTPDAFNGKMLGIMGAAVEGRLDNGVPFGSVSGLLYLNMPRIMRGKYVIPAAVFDVTDYELKYLLILRLAIAERNITYMGGANPSTFMKLQSLLTQHGQLLIDDIRTGGFHRSLDLDKPIIDEVESLFHADPLRAQRLQGMIDHEKLSYANVWPNLRLLTTWTGGSCGVALGQLKKFLPEHTRIADLGYIASEFRGTIPLTYLDASGIPLLNENFYEFVQKENWESGNVHFLMLDKLKEGNDYYIFITTQSGLFRYKMDDIIRVTGFYKKTPLLLFVQKGKGITSITGEKLYESQILEAMDDSCLELNIELPFYLVLANTEKACYELYFEADRIDQLAQTFDRKLCELNIEYNSKRESGRLGDVGIFVLKPGTSEAYKQFMLQSGQREGQFKPVLLQHSHEIEFPINNYIAT